MSTKQDTFETKLDRKSIETQRVSLKSGQDGTIKEGTELRKIRGKDGRTMYQAWDVEIDTARNTVRERKNYRQLSGSRGFAGAHNSGQRISGIESGSVENKNIADSTNTRTIVRGTANGRQQEFLLRDQNQTFNVMSLAARENIDGDRVVGTDATGKDIRLSEIRQMLESPDKVIAYTTQ